MSESSLVALALNVSRLERKLNHIQRTLNRILTKENIMSASLDALQAAVTRNGEVEDSAVLLIQGLAKQITDAAGDPAKLAELSASLTAQAETLAAAIVANTPAT